MLQSSYKNQTQEASWHTNKSNMVLPFSGWLPDNPEKYESGIQINSQKFYLK